MLPVSQSQISPNTIISSSSTSSTVPYKDLDLAFAHLLFNSKKFKVNIKDFSLAIQSKMKYPINIHSTIISESTKCIINQYNSLIIVIGKKRENECYDKVLNESLYKEQFPLIPSQTIQSNIKLIDIIKEFILKSENKYTEEHSKSEIVLLFIIFQLNYSLTINRNKESIIKFKKGNDFLGQDAPISSVQTIFKLELEEIINKLQKLIQQ